jgi:hypothetical protein
MSCPAEAESFPGRLRAQPLLRFGVALVSPCCAGVVLTLLMLLLGSDSVAAEQAAAPPDRSVMRFFAPDLGGAPTPQFIFERELAFEARLQALADPDQSKDSPKPYLARHVRSAIERHIAESLLANLRVDPAPSDEELDRQAESARRILSERVGGSPALVAAAKAEGMSEREVTILLRRQARASIYLDRMVAPMLTPTRTELRQVYAVERHPFTQSSFEEIEPLLRNWWIGHRLSDAVEQYFANARQRVVVTLTVPASEELKAGAGQNARPLGAK